MKNDASPDGSSVETSHAAVPTFELPAQPEDTADPAADLNSGSQQADRGQTLRITRDALRLLLHETRDAYVHVGDFAAAREIGARKAAPQLVVGGNQVDVRPRTSIEEAVRELLSQSQGVGKAKDLQATLVESTRLPVDVWKSRAAEAENEERVRGDNESVLPTGDDGLHSNALTTEDASTAEAPARRLNNGGATGVPLALRFESNSAPTGPSPLGPRDMPPEQIVEAPENDDPPPMGYRERWVDQPKGPRRRKREPVYGPEHDFKDLGEDWNPDSLNARLQRAGDARDPRNRQLTVGTLRDLSYFSYRDDFGGVEPHKRIPDGWELIDSANTDNGYYGVALYHRASGTIVLVNRGTQFSEILSSTGDAFDDIDDDLKIWDGRASKQIDAAIVFAQRVASFVRANPSRFAGVRGWIATGHSLGGALAQAQVAYGRLDPRSGLRNVRGVVFAALGARDTITRALGGRLPGIQDVGAALSDIDGSIVNYVRVGDGLTFLNRDGFGNRPRGVGLTVVLRGLHMPRIRGGAAISQVPIAGQALSLLTLPQAYIENHDVRTFVHDDFDRSVDEMFAQRQADFARGRRRRR